MDGGCGETRNTSRPLGRLETCRCRCQCPGNYECPFRSQSGSRHARRDCQERQSDRGSVGLKKGIFTTFVVSVEATRNAPPISRNNNPEASFTDSPLDFWPQLPANHTPAPDLLPLPELVLFFLSDSSLVSHPVADKNISKCTRCKRTFSTSPSQCRNS